MFYQRARQLFKHTLSSAGFKILYARITLTHFTAFYFVLSLASCVGLVAMQGLTLTDNTQAVNLLTSVLNQSQRITGLPIVTDGVLRICSDIPDRSTNCTAMAFFNGGTPLTEGNPNTANVLNLTKREQFEDTRLLFARHGSKEDPAEAADVSLNLSLGLSDSCVASLRWLDDVLRDAQREDVVTLFFRIWLFILAVITIVNESIPHLGAGFLSHVLGTAWAAYRLQSTFKMMDLYRKQIVPNACGGIDLVGNWWEIRISHATPILVFNVIALLGSGYVSYKLFQVYANQSFCRVGASERVYRIYKIVLLFSVCMQISGFFSIASTAMWIDKICHGILHTLAEHPDLYLAAFITTLVMHVPWLYFGWICVRKECRVRFGVFCGISVFLATISTLVFFSGLYRYIFLTWPFFATVTVTAYCLILASTVLGVICQFNFGQGLAHYLLVTEALEGVNFTPVNFSTKANNTTIDVEKNEKKHFKNTSNGSSVDTIPDFPIAVWQPPMNGHDITTVDRSVANGGFNADTNTNNGVQVNNGNNHIATTYNVNGARRPRGPSVYSERYGEPIVLSFSPPLVSELGPAPNRFSTRSRRNTRGSAVRDGVGAFGVGDRIAEEPARPPGIGEGVGGMGMNEWTGKTDKNESGDMTMKTTITRPPPIAISAINTDVRNSRINAKAKMTSSPVFDTPVSMSTAGVRGYGNSEMGIVREQSKNRSGSVNGDARKRSGSVTSNSGRSDTGTRYSGLPANPRHGSPPSGRNLTGGGVGLPASPRSKAALGDGSGKT